VNSQLPRLGSSYGPKPNSGATATPLRLVGHDAGKVLKGAKARPICRSRQPTNPRVVIKPSKTAQALGLEIPPSLLQRGDQVIE